MSFGSGTGRTRPGTKGFSGSEKKQRKKKQEFHTHRKAHTQESEHLDAEDVKARTLLALDRLGHQVLSNESGGYDLEDWTRNLNSLLDDFQEKMGADTITEEFSARRRAALLLVAERQGSQGVDSEIERAVQEESAARAVLADLARKAAAKLAAMRDERDTCSKELKHEKEKVAELTEAKKSRRFFSRLMGAGPSTVQTEARVAELESKLARLEDEINRNRKDRSGHVDSAAAEGSSASLEAQLNLEAVQKKLRDLHSAKQSSLQLSHERETATRTISEVIASMRVGPSASEGGARS